MTLFLVKRLTPTLSWVIDYALISSMTKIVAIIQSRQGSSRLPGKALKPLFNGKGALELMLQRVAPSKKVHQFIVATTRSESDNAIESLCKQLEVACFRGSEEDVLDRYFEAAKLVKATHIVRLTGDCPIQDYEVIDRLVSSFFEDDLDYAANAITPTYPDGFDAEIFTMETLKLLKEKATKPSEKEHVTPYIHSHPELFKIKNVSFNRDVSHLRLTLDTIEDFDVLQKLAPLVFGGTEYCHINSILDYLDSHPSLLEINKKYERNEGYKKSLEKDLNN
ncbi:hypothetical protein DID80_01135 [Candidatus Marinamargulisbacteria bacterium SCGC AAA071-K20]|nr:hypothetical protein DID80_01135 [Candidatus Marinamargulisbacteria bacterium SCGC AAA071-K20]